MTYMSFISACIQKEAILYKNAIFYSDEYFHAMM